jgi:hypothetical protein
MPHDPSPARARKREREYFVGWAKRSVPTIQDITVGRWWARRECAFAHPTDPGIYAIVAFSAVAADA